MIAIPRAKSFVGKFPHNMQKAKGEKGSSPDGAFLVASLIPAHASG